MLLGTYTGEADSVFSGLALKLHRWDGKGFTSLSVTGPGAADLAVFVAANVNERIDGNHVRRVGSNAIGEGFQVSVWGRKRQTSGAIADALRSYSFRVAGKHQGARVPMLDLVSAVPAERVGA